MTAIVEVYRCDLRQRLLPWLRDRWPELATDYRPIGHDLAEAWGARRRVCVRPCVSCRNGAVCVTPLSLDVPSPSRRWRIEL